MRVLVIYAHPVETSFNAAAHAAVLAGLREANHDVDDLDLYAEGFQPCLTREERLAYHDVAANRTGVDRYVTRLRAADAVVFVFPAWSYGVPAILKGFFDRVMLPGVAFELGPAGRVRPLLGNVRRLLAVVTYGQPRWMVRFGIGDLPRLQITRYFRWSCAREARVSYYGFYGMNRATPSSRASFLAKIQAAMAALA